MGRFWRSRGTPLAWLLAVVRWGGDAEFSWHYILPWLGKFALPVFAGMLAVTFAVVRDVPLWGIPPISAAAALLVGLVVTNARRIGEALPMAKEQESPEQQDSVGESEGEADDKVVISGRDNVVSVGQSGGQTARQILNIGPQPRTLAGVAVGPIVERLSTFADTEISVFCMMGDGESLQLADQVLDLIIRAGWKVKDTGQAVAGLVKGITLYPESDPPMQELLQCLVDMGFDAHAVKEPNLSRSRGERELFFGSPGLEADEPFPGTLAHHHSPPFPAVDALHGKA